MKLAIGLAGGIGSGKSAASDYLHREYGAKRLRFSRILEDILDRLHLPCDRKNLQVLGGILRERFGPDVVVNAFEKDLEKADADIVVVDGIRYVNEVEMLRRLENSVLVYIDAPQAVRYERSVRRAEKGEAGASFDDFLEAEQRETEIYLPDVRKAADHIIMNDGTMEELFGKLDGIIEGKKQEMRSLSEATLIITV